MNKTSRQHRCKPTDSRVSVPEVVWTQGGVLSRASLRSRLALGTFLSTCVVLGPVMAGPPAVNQLPTGGQVVAGSASIAQSGATMNINQSTQRAAINWQTFNVGSSATVNFNQPSASSVTLNRVLDSNPSQIYGHINAPGQVFFTNPNGVYFSPSSSVDVGGLVATTHGISDADFMAGNNKFTRDGASGSIVNDGSLKAKLGGYIALLAPEVRNQGVIVAQLGTVALAAGDAYTLQFSGNNTLADILVTPATIQALVQNGNAVQAPGGLIILSARAADSLQGGVVNNSGALEATRLNNVGGRIVLKGDAVVHTGSATAGTITVNAGNVVDAGSWNASAARNGTADGGAIEVAATGGIEQTVAGTMSADGETGGSVSLSAGSGAYLSGAISARGSQRGGGVITVTASNLTLAGARLHVDGASGGGVAGCENTRFVGAQ